MLYAFGFDRIGVLVSDLYLALPSAEQGRERSPEQGVRLELRILECGDADGSLRHARPITAERPLWRVDLLETVTGPAGSLDQAHHHPNFQGWAPGRRVFDPDLSADPLAWVAERLSDLDGVLAEIGMASSAAVADSTGLRAEVPHVMDCVSRLLEGVRSGRLGQPPGDGPVQPTRKSWL
ncbi:hypothetical protein [Actinomadura algeriensis]|uniref:Golgi phosphoprotein 3 GPP34 n=1 Tax=Actinomadura algeriensis TaxID=1679523 RepID=A0ABR9JPU9_9ACTN|nr:hypothetical protein [Actinomadura algeriensis]MBE1532125.1 hypothetical protein [Actinomadura algeriensis]